MRNRFKSIISEIQGTKHTMLENDETFIFWLKPPDAANGIFALCLSDICYNIWSVNLHLESKRKMSDTEADVLVWKRHFSPSKLRKSHWCCYRIPPKKSPAATVLDQNSIINNHSAYLACFIHKNALSSFFKNNKSVVWRSAACGNLFHFAVLLHVTQNFLPLAHHVEVELRE